MKNEIHYELRLLINNLKFYIIGYDESVQIIILVVPSFVATCFAVHACFSVNELICSASRLLPAFWRLRLYVFLLLVITDVELQARSARQPDWSLLLLFIRKVNAMSQRRLVGVKHTRSGAFRSSWRWHSSGRRNWASEVVARNDLLNDVTNSDGATRSRSGHPFGNQELVTMELAVGITIRQLLLLHFHYASEFEAHGYTSMSLDESLLAVPNYNFRTMPWLVAH